MCVEPGDGRGQSPAALAEPRSAQSAVARKPPATGHERELALPPLATRPSSRATISVPIRRAPSPSRSPVEARRQKPGHISDERIPPVDSAPRVPPAKLDPSVRGPASPRLGSRPRPSKPVDHLTDIAPRSRTPRHRKTTLPTADDRQIGLWSPSSRPTCPDASARARSQPSARGAKPSRAASPQ